MIKTEVNSNINLLILQKAGIRRGNNLEIHSDQNPKYSCISSEAKNHRKTPLRIVVLAPHQDDEEFSAATMMQFSRDLAIIFYAFYTDGREGSGTYSRRLGLTSEQLVKQREAEQTASINHLATINPNISKVEIFNRRDMQLAKYYDDALEATIDFCKAFTIDLIIFPNPFEDYHPDHLATGQIGLAAAKALDITAYMHDTQFGKQWITPTHLQLGENYQQMNTDEYFRKLIEIDKYYVGDTLVSISPDIMYQTLLALRKHVSQFTNTNHLSRILQSKVVRGSWAGNDVQYADTYTLAHQSSKDGDNAINPFVLLLPNSVYQKEK